ncbi:MAG: hypothetical protein ABFD89_21840 [Bryobacteraceae bacterium]
MRVVGILVLLLAAAATGVAQNSDLGILAEVSLQDARVGLQVNYAYQLLEWSAGRLYLEVPLIMPVVPHGAQEQFRKIFITPGIRYHFNLTDRAALYASAGVGFVSTPFAPKIGWAVSFGGGLDYRLTRLWSVRGDVRHLMGSSKLDSPDRLLYLGHAPRNDTVLSMGIGLHF